MKLAMLCFLFAGIVLVAGDGQALYAGAHVVGALVSSGIGLLLMMKRPSTKGGGCLWLPLVAILGLAAYLVATNGGL